MYELFNNVNLKRLTMKSNECKTYRIDPKQIFENGKIKDP